MRLVSDRYRRTAAYFAIRAELIRAAEYHGYTTYQYIAFLMGLPSSGAHMANEVGHILGEISEDENAAGRPMLSAVAVGTNGDPGQGFYALAKGLRLMRRAGSHKSFWKRQRESVYATWKRRIPTGKSAAASASSHS